jgi:hypothetical protein
MDLSPNTPSSEIESVIACFGGMSALSRALGHKNPTTVQGWKLSGRIPAWRRSEIVTAAQRLGVILPDSFVATTEAA